MNEPRHGRRGPGGTRRALLVLAGILALVPGQAAGQGGTPAERPLSLERALELARSGNAALSVAEAEAEAASARSRAAGATLLPHVELATGWLRTPDPVAVFGTKLRQERFRQEDFALPALNDPAPVDDWTAEARVRWRLADPSAWARRAAASHSAEAAGSSRARAAEAVVLGTRVLYVDALRAEAHLEAAGAAVEAARATVDRFRRRMEEGVLTRAEVLQAEAELAAARGAAVRARQVRQEARLALGLHLGWSADTVPVPTDTLGPPDGREGPEANLAGSVIPAGRADIRALRNRLRAEEAGQRAARLAYLPRLSAFAGYAAHARDPFSADGTDWSAGVQLEWSLFDGFGRSARLAMADAHVRRARARLDEAVRGAAVEVARARNGVRSAVEALEAARAASRAASAGRDLMRRRFEEGLAGPADLLGAEARAAEMRARAVDALADYHVARARLDFTLGRAGNLSGAPETRP